jgi:hypothetical protein
MNRITALAVISTVLAAAMVPGPPAGARRAWATFPLCSLESSQVANGAYVVQNNEYNSFSAECVSADGGTYFAVRDSSISSRYDLTPAAYPSIYAGCAWGTCSSGGLASHPVRLSALASGAVTSTWWTTQPAAAGNIFAASYDVWLDRSASRWGPPDGVQLLIWTGHSHAVRPSGHLVASGVRIDGIGYDIWRNWDNVITYERVPATWHVIRLDIGDIARDLVSRGLASPGWYLTAVQAGFQIWQAGAGLATSYFNVRAGR